MLDRSASIEQFIRENGITFHADQSQGAVPSDEDEETANRPWQLSVIPFVMGSAEWNVLSDGLVQRTHLLERILVDLLGEQRLIREGVVPGELFWANPVFSRAYHGLEGTPQKLHVTATDLVRGVDGLWRVTGDRTRAPSGLGYLLENRIVMGRVLPKLIRRSNTRRLASFFESLREHLQSLAPQDRSNPRVALLAPPSGSYREFEDTYLARYLGLTLVRGSDLAIRGGCLHVKTLGGLLPIQVLWRHISDRRCDPLELDPASNQGVAGLLRCVRHGRVAVVNAIGSVLAQTPGLMPYLEQANQFFFGGSLQLPSLKSYWLGDPQQRAYVLDHLDSLVLRSAYTVSSQEPIDTTRLSQQERAEFLQRIEADPGQFLAQERLAYSSTPVWIGGQVKPQRVALRNFQLIRGDRVEVLPGALARVGNDEMELSRSPVSGQRTLDCWVTSDVPLGKHKSLLPSGRNAIKLRRIGDELPSRVAEHLYWLGRYVERAEGISRLMRTTLSRLSGEETTEMAAELPRLTYALASLGQIEPGYAVDSFVAGLPNLDQVLPASVLDPEQPRGLIRTMQSVMHNATAVRDRLSNDAYRILRRAFRELNQPASASGRAVSEGMGYGEAIERVGTLIVDLLAFAGVTSEGFVRTHSWQFLELGRRIERADQTCDLLLTMLCPATENGKAICEAALEITDSLMTYRSRYLNLVRLAPVVDLIVTDDTNPRSVLYQLDRISDVIEKLPAVEGPVRLDAIERIVLDMQYQVKLADPYQLCQTSDDGTLEQLGKLLRGIAGRLPELSDAISAHYLIHTAATQQLTGTGR
ncbi:circularly permuted type 2 ATP-grasp protein [Roseiconus nitratireducens]|uniref:Circularly permuted type 2 ATP-grasp protein n=2 Tax=Roseiconus nitratireducens TaxID=2605748 RepID=A0A5M6DHD7_9BACT|nr:circularly permuted type 2 ATP-grasp protein [Roseiconus nitratireducens]